MKRARPPSSKRTRADWFDDDNPMIPHLEVSDHEAIWTGLLDQYGDEIWREPNRMGFHNPLDPDE